MKHFTIENGTVKALSYKMSRNHFSELNEELASLYWTQKERGVTFLMKDWDKLVNEIELIDFETYSQNETLNKFINSYFETMTENTEEKRTFKGHTTSDSWSFFIKLKGLTEDFKQIYSDSYTFDVYSRKELFTASYCEGDIWIKTFKTLESLNQEIERVTKWNEENR